MTDRIIEFKGEFEFLSNFFPVQVYWDGLPFDCVENAYQAAKEKTQELRLKYMNVTPGQAKKMGRQCDCRDDWELIKDNVMDNLLRQKFKKGTTLGKMLEDTGERELVEGNWWGDRYWGVCQGEGKNMLGKLLMGIRFENSYFE